MDNVGIYETFFNPDMNLININLANLPCNYYTEHLFNNLSNFHSDSNLDLNIFSTLLLNVHSLTKNFDELKTFLSTLTHFIFFSFGIHRNLVK